jgi:hypothetical protein
MAALTVALVSMVDSGLSAQGRGGAPQTPQAGAPIDLDGYWVSIVNEDWRWRMVTPPAGDFASLPLNDEGVLAGNMWTPEMDGQCEAYGVGGLMRMPTRLLITWADESTLQIETDAGMQARQLHFTGMAPGAPSLQGYSEANWERPPRQGRGANAVQPPGGTLHAMTTNTTGGWLRKNGAPYSADAEIEEYFDRFPSPNGDEWLVVTTIVTDPTYLTQPFITSSHFKREIGTAAAAPANWNPTTCG